MGTNPGRTHRFFNGSAVIPFGFGLSYTTFTYNIVAAPAATLSLAPVQALLADSEANKHSFPSLFASQAPAAAPAKYLVNVSNTGSIDSDDVVLGFIFPPNARWELSFAMPFCPLGNCLSPNSQGCTCFVIHFWKSQHPNLHWVLYGYRLRIYSGLYSPK